MPHPDRSSPNSSINGIGAHTIASKSWQQYGTVSKTHCPDTDERKSKTSSSAGPVVENLEFDLNKSKYSSSSISAKKKISSSVYSTSGAAVVAVVSALGSDDCLRSRDDVLRRLSSLIDLLRSAGDVAARSAASAGGAEAVFRACAAWPSDAAVQAQGLLITWFLAKDTLCVTSLVSAGGCGVAVDSLLQHRESDVVAETALCAIESLDK